MPYWSRRLLMKPGITGWAQVCAPYAADCRSRHEFSYDLWYLRHRSIFVDLAICAEDGGRDALRARLATTRRALSRDRR